MKILSKNCAIIILVAACSKEEVKVASTKNVKTANNCYQNCDSKNSTESSNLTGQINSLPTEFPINMGFKTLLSKRDGSIAGNENFDTFDNVVNYFPINFGYLSDMPKIKTANPTGITLVANPGGDMHVHSEDINTGTDTFPGHFLYYVGSTLTAPINQTDTIIKVKDVLPFLQINKDGSRDTNDHAIIYQRKIENGKLVPDWTSFEYVQLFGYNLTQKTIHIKRGTTGSTTKSFPAESYIAPHVASWETDEECKACAKIINPLQKTDTVIHISTDNISPFTQTPVKVVIYTKTPDGSPVLQSVEHAVLASYSATDNSFTLTRGADAKAYPSSNNSYISIDAKGWDTDTKSNSQLFRLNYSLHAPKDPLTQLQANEWAANSVGAGLVATGLDGVEHDEIFNSYNRDRAIDVDNNGEADWGYFDGINSFGLGLQEYTRLLRKNAPGKIIQFDSDKPRNGYRGFNYANGIQMETFMDGEHFSEAYEHLYHWTQKATATPKFSYGYCRKPTRLYHSQNVKYSENKEFRNQFAVGVMVNMPHPYGSGKDMGIFNWDEESGGSDVPPDHRYKWLGSAIDASPVRELPATPNLLDGATWNVAVKDGYVAQNGGRIDNPTDGARYESNTVTPFTPTFGNSIKTIKFPPNTNRPDYNGVELRLNTKIPKLIVGNEYTLTFDARATTDYSLLNKSFTNTPFQIAVGGFGGYDAHILADIAWHSYTLSFKAINYPSAISFAVSETMGSVMFKNITFQEGTADRMSRTFKHGKVFLNMSKDPWIIDSSTRPDLLPVANNYNYLKGTLINPDGTQANPQNTGLPVGQKFTVEPYDAVFLIDLKSYSETN